jgi:RNA polymerase sigma factor (TIGR02999 family)
MPDVSTLLNDKASGVQDSADRLFRLLYDELRNMAGAQLQHGGGRRVLGTTTLVHESYLRFIKKGELAPEDRDHFLAYASHVMRSIIVDAARRQLASKRGAGQPHVMLSDEAIANVTASDVQIIRLHEALEELAELEPRMAKIIEMRYFGGLEEKEIAHVLAVSLRTVQRDWEKARALLSSALKD